MQRELNELKDEVRKLKTENDFLIDSVEKIQHEFSSFKTGII